MKTLVVLQPGYIPWLGFFDQMNKSDAFVYYDDVQFDKNGWRNRNRVKSPDGPHWLTVPVLHKNLESKILEVEIDNRMPWARKHTGTLKQFYAKAPFLKDYLPELEELLSREWKFLVDLDFAVIELICRWLGLRRTLLRSSELSIEEIKSERLINICSSLKANRYLTGDAAKEYLDETLFQKNGIEVLWHEYKHPVYRQLHGPFVPYLSILDLIFNEGPASREILQVVS